MTDEYKIKIGQFEGPLELLLDLIEKKKLHINDVSLATVADGYLEYLKNLEQFPTQDVANFITIASTLILIKSISLLPILETTVEEEQDIEELQERLRILKNVKDRAAYLKTIFGKTIIFHANDRKNYQSVFSPTSEITLENFLVSIRRVVANLPKKDVLPEAVVRKVMSLNEAIENLVVRVQKDLRTSFSKLNTEKEKVTIIVNFLAILELVKRGVIFIKQDRHFCDIDIESGFGKVPVY